MTAPIIETTNLTKRFGPQTALDNVSLNVQRGAIGLLGPNGAGKSTFMKCLLQLQPITGGSARLLDELFDARLFLTDQQIFPQTANVPVVLKLFSPVISLRRV